jgi:hypothetical protein
VRTSRYEDDKIGDASSHSFASLASAEITSYLRLRKSESPEDQFQPVDYPSGPAFIKMVNEAMRAYAPASEHNLTSPSEVLHAIRGFKVGKASGPNGIPNTVLRHLPKRAITILTK